MLAPTHRSSNAQSQHQAAKADTQTEAVAALVQLRTQLEALWLLLNAAEIDNYSK